MGLLHRLLVQCEKTNTTMELFLLRKTCLSVRCVRGNVRGEELDAHWNFCVEQSLEN